jgi:uncharacterized SAM-binding protein YcdF (DUF218 family)
MFLVFKSLCKLIFVVVVFWFAGFLYFVNLVPKEASTDIPETEAIIVLTGGDKRIEEGFNILQQKKSKKLFITGIDTKVRRLSEVSRLYSSMKKEDKEKVELGQEAITTSGNAIETKQWAEKSNIKTLTLVTANYHMPRSLMEFRKAFPNMKIVEYPVFPPRFQIKNWWRYPGSTLLLVKEYNKCLYLLYSMHHFS